MVMKNIESDILLNAYIGTTSKIESLEKRILHAEGAIHVRKNDLDLKQRKYLHVTIEELENNISGFKVELAHQKHILAEVDKRYFEETH